MIQTVNKLIDQAERYCKDKGIRLTEKRKLTFALLLKKARAVSAYELVDAYKAEYGKEMPAMSMYRILEFLVAEGFVHRLSLANKYVACEGGGCHHQQAATQFLICGECQNVEEIPLQNSTMNELMKNVRDAGFHLSNQQLEMKGLCQKCVVEEQ